MAGPERRKCTVHRTRASLGVRLKCEFQLEAERCFFERRDFLYVEGIACAGRALARPLQLCRAALIVGLQIASAGCVADQRVPGHRKGEDKECSLLSHTPDYGDESYLSPAVPL